jgi:hypothetical protein
MGVHHIEWLPCSEGDVLLAVREWHDERVRVQLLMVSGDVVVGDWLHQPTMALPGVSVDRRLATDDRAGTARDSSGSPSTLTHRLRQ